MMTVSAKIKPGSSQDKIVVDDNGLWTIWIKERPIDGKANEYLIKFLAEKMSLPKSKISIDKGLKTKVKKISFDLPDSVFNELVKQYQS